MEPGNGFGVPVLPNGLRIVFPSTVEIELDAIHHDGRSLYTPSVLIFGATDDHFDILTSIVIDMVGSLSWMIVRRFDRIHTCAYSFEAFHSHDGIILS